MSIEWQMGAVKRQIMLHKQANQFVAFARPRMRRPPEQAMVHNKQICFCFYRQPDSGKAGIDRCCNARDTSPILDLESVGCALVIVNFSGAKQPVTIAYDLGQGDSLHERETVKRDLNP